VLCLHNASKHGLAWCGVQDTMIRHWEHQIMAHVKPGQLRVVVVVTGADTQGPLSAKQLAWDYDLVSE
jgi:hypothetical protein